MNWDRVNYSEGDGFYWSAKSDGFSADVSCAPWINTEKPWTTEVYLGLGYIRLSPSATADAAKAKARRHVMSFGQRLTEWAGGEG